MKKCYVCGHSISKNPVYIGKELYRHIRCQPGTQRWLQSEIAKKSNIREFFKEKVNEF